MTDGAGHPTSPMTRTVRVSRDALTPFAYVAYGVFVGATIVGLTWLATLIEWGM